MLRPSRILLKVLLPLIESATIQNSATMIITYDCRRKMTIIRCSDMKLTWLEIVQLCAKLRKNVQNCAIYDKFDPTKQKMGECPTWIRQSRQWETARVGSEKVLMHAETVCPIKNILYMLHFSYELTIKVNRKVAMKAPNNNDEKSNKDKNSVYCVLVLYITWKTQ